MNRNRRDEGAVLPLVLVMIVVSALIVIPLLGYSVSVLKANTVVAGNTRDREAAEGAIRVALADSSSLFASCVGGSRAVTPAAAPVAGINVATTCALVEEVGPLDLAADGSPILQTPVGTTAVQLGATLPTTLSGTTRVSPAVPPYPADERWWTATSQLTEGETWLPDLPPRPSTERRTSYAMPSGFNCTVYLPGYYPNPLTVTSGKVYFASGVYYFENAVTFSGDADVIVGMGIQSWSDTECANDTQVRANLLSKPSVLGIDGGGATFVFGANGNLVIDNAATSAGLSVKFNQRYAEPTRGGRVSIMSVNGDDVLVPASLPTPTTGEHRVDDVVAVPRSVVMDGSGVAKPVGVQNATGQYLPSNSTYTSEAIAPAAPKDLRVTSFTTPTAMPPANDNGGALFSWQAVSGQDAGGAVITGYTVEYQVGSTRTTTSCTIVAPEPGRLGCVLSGLRKGASTTFSVRATNSVGTSPWASSSGVTVKSTDPLVKAPDAPTGVTVTPYRDAAGISWAPATGNGAPIVGYTVTAEVMYRKARTPAADEGDEAPPAQYDELYRPAGACNTAASGTTAAATSCVISGLTPLDTSLVNGEQNVGYRFVVTATNSIGTSTTAVVAPTYTSFTGDAPPAPPAPAVTVVEPRRPTAIVKISATKDIRTTVSIPGYVSVPMGRISIVNPKAKDVRVTGGILTSTLEVDDARSTTPDPWPIGYKNDIVLQRTVLIIAKAGNTAVSAQVQINENGEFAVNSWVVS